METAHPNTHEKSIVCSSHGLMRRILVSSEGLGNSQKTEIAWLQRKGYAYMQALSLQPCIYGGGGGHFEVGGDLKPEIVSPTN